MVVYAAVYDPNGNGELTEVWKLFRERQKALDWISDIEERDPRVLNKLIVREMWVY